MQDIHSIANGGGVRRLIGGNDSHALKCPRCDSLNTKFCYYNNYNLSQPRYFCKTCRRYWTNGGVLRNVPVGGGCRKKKRSKLKSRKTNANTCSRVRKSSDSDDSSSGSSSLTATTINTAANTTVTTTAPVNVSEVLSGKNSTNSAPTLVHFPEASQNPSFDPPLLEQHNVFHEIDALTSLITSSTDQLPVDFNLSDGISPFRLHHTGRMADHSIGDDLKVQETSSLGLMDAHTPEKIIDGGFGTEDWNSCTDEALFDLTGTVDQSYWNQTQWDQ
ncbi:hypothetical protein QVD17_01640 [Tagetes erecta]|uniref:Dof zinc finger protein n=1 Tax=Tagetes erecta TaxID=13708 RepID=A0AAD8L7L6_TARER|nr:hypothetical protein QVD17_01640 [Tagetes erecta]